MKFLCVPCDTAMALEGKPKPDRGSITLVYSCPDCGYEFAMLTNPAETQVVGSLGVNIGADGGEAAASASKCPFTGMVQGAEAPDDAGDATASSVSWTAAARARMENLPEFVRPMVEMGIERFAKDKGYAEVDEELLDQARSHLGM